MDETLRSIMSQMSDWAGREPDEIEHIPGKTNQNYKIRMGDQRYVVRVSGPNTVLLGIDRKVEYAVLKKVASIGVGPEPILFVEAASGNRKNSRPTPTSAASPRP